MAGKSGKKVLALIDGQHYLHAIRAALHHAEEVLGYSVVGTLLLGATGKLGSVDSLIELELPVVVSTGDFPASVKEACRKFEPEAVLDLSGDPPLDMQTRLRIAGTVLSSGVAYIGPDFQFTPVSKPDLPTTPTIAVLGAGKRVGKTAVCAFAAREIAASGMNPVIITMGRGGPAEPELIRGDQIQLTPEFLINEAKRGLHAASDCYEEALVTRLPAIGCFRAGGGLAGSPFCSTVQKGAEIANSLECDIQIYEGSGKTVPPVRLDARILVVSASQSPAISMQTFDPFGLQHVDMVVVTGCEEPLLSSGQAGELIDTLRSVARQALIKTVVLRPRPLGDIKGRKVGFATTAPVDIVETLVSHIEKTHECKIVAMTAALSDRSRLKKEMASLLSGQEKPEVLLTELKAASIQVAVPMAIEAGLEVVFCDNVPEAVMGSEPRLDMDMTAIAQLAVDRFRAGHSPEVAS
jgi:cyclic 2,3-diphosphoglycerate synthetase